MNVLSIILFVVNLINSDDLSSPKGIFSIILTLIPIISEIYVLFSIRGYLYILKAIILQTVCDLFPDCMKELYFSTEFTNLNSAWYMGSYEGNIKKIYHNELNNFEIINFDIRKYYKKLEDDLKDYTNHISYLFRSHDFNYYEDKLGNSKLKICSQSNSRMYSIWNINYKEHEDMILFIKRDFYMVINVKTSKLDGLVHKLNYFEKIILYQKHKNDIETIKIKIDEIEDVKIKVACFYEYIPFFLISSLGLIVCELVAVLLMLLIPLVYLCFNFLVILSIINSEDLFSDYLKGIKIVIMLPFHKKTGYFLI